MGQPQYDEFCFIAKLASKLQECVTVKCMQSLDSITFEVLQILFPKDHSLIRDKRFIKCTMSNRNFEADINPTLLPSSS